MSLPRVPQAQVFAELVPWADRGQENNVFAGRDTLSGYRRPLPTAQAHNATREVHVSGAAEVSASPDRAQVAVRISSTKEAAAEAKKSVCRRLDYISQSLQQQGLQVSALRERSLEPDCKDPTSEVPTLTAPHWCYGTWQSESFY